MQKKFETIVVGLGAMGSAATYQLAKRGANVLGIDQFSPPHTLGSTHGDTRITRQAIGEGEQFVPLAVRSHQIWREIEKETGMDLLTITGCALIGARKTVVSHGTDHFFDSALAAAKKFNLAHEVMDGKTFMSRYPQFHLKGDERILLDKNGGFVRPERCIDAQLSLAKKYGANVHLNEKFLRFECSSDGKSVKVVTDKGEYVSVKLILSAGPWIEQLLPEFAQFFKVYRQVLFWFDVPGSIEPFLPHNCPVFMWEGNDAIYGFPAVDGPRGGVKVAGEDYYSKTTTPEKVNRTISDDEIRNMYLKHLKEQLPALSEKCIKAAACLYTVTPDANFVIDVHPKHPQIIVASPCSGHGFKHSAAIGEVLAEMAIQKKSTIDISAFAFSRLQ